MSANSLAWLKVNVVRSTGVGSDETVINLAEVSAIRKAASGGALIFFGFMPHAAASASLLEMVTVESYDDVLKKIL